MLENVLILVTVNVRLDLMATTVDFGQVCIVVVFRYCTLAYDCGLRSGMYWVSLHVLYLGLRLWTSVRHVLWLSSGIVPWATTGPRSGMYCVSVIVLGKSWLFWGQTACLHAGNYIYFGNCEFTPGFNGYDTTVDFGRVCIVFLFSYCTLAYDCGLRSDMYCVSLQVLYLGLRLWTSVRYALCFSSGIVP
jgi:hypothetical protein